MKEPSMTATLLLEPAVAGQAHAATCSLTGTTAIQQVVDSGRPTSDDSSWSNKPG